MKVAYHFYFILNHSLLHLYNRKITGSTPGRQAARDRIAAARQRAIEARAAEMAKVYNSICDQREIDTCVVGRLKVGQEVRATPLCAYKYWRPLLTS